MFELFPLWNKKVKEKPGFAWLCHSFYPQQLGVSQGLRAERETCPSPSGFKGLRLPVPCRCCWLPEASSWLFHKCAFFYSLFWPEADNPASLLLGIIWPVRRHLPVCWPGPGYYNLPAAARSSFLPLSCPLQVQSTPGALLRVLSPPRMQFWTSFALSVESSVFPLFQKLLKFSDLMIACFL